MNEAVVVAAANYSAASIRAASVEAIAKVRSLEDRIREEKQIQFCTEHVLHGGMYSRTVRIPAGVVFTSVLIKCPTVLILNGTCDVLVGDMGVRFEGYNVIACEAGRKTAYITRTQVELTMLFPSSAKTVAEAEAQFTDEVEQLLSRTNKNDIVITESPCLESQQQPLS